MKRIGLDITDELYAALEHARQERPMGPYVEQLLRSAAAIRKAARELEIEFPARRMHARGRPRKSGRESGPD